MLSSTISNMPNMPNQLFSRLPTDVNIENDINRKYQEVGEIRLDSNSFKSLKNLVGGFPNTNNKPSCKNYLVKIDDEYKLVTECNHLNSEQLEKIISTYYKANEIEIFPVANNVNLLSNYICSSNSFLKTNEIDPKLFIDYLIKFDEIINFLTIFDSSTKFTNALQDIGKSIDNDSSKLAETNNVEQQLKCLDENHLVCPKSIIGSTIFDITGSYINDNTSSIEGITSYSNGLFDDIDDGNYEFGPVVSYMNLENFDESILDYQKEYTIYFNNQFNNVIIIESRSDFIGSNTKFKKLFPEIVFVAKERIGKETYLEVSKLIQDIFVNVDDVKTKLNKILHDKIIDSKLSIDEIKFLIKKYFSIDTNPEHCIKFTNIWEIISSELKVSESFVNYTKRQLPIILKDLGLDKKRLSDGIYWYGLVRKPLNNTGTSDNFINSVIEDEPIPVEQFKSIFDKYIIDRDVDLKSVVLSYRNSQLSQPSQPTKNESTESTEFTKSVELGSIMEFVKKIEPDNNEQANIVKKSSKSKVKTSKVTNRKVQSKNC